MYFNQPWTSLLSKHRSSATQLPSMLIIMAIYLFFCVVVLTWWVIMPNIAAAILTIGGFLIIMHIINTFSSIGNVVMVSFFLLANALVYRGRQIKLIRGCILFALSWKYTGAMSHMPILEDEEGKFSEKQNLSWNFCNESFCWKCVRGCQCTICGVAGWISSP